MATVNGSKTFGTTYDPEASSWASVCPIDMVDGVCSVVEERTMLGIPKATTEIELGNIIWID